MQRSEFRLIAYGSQREANSVANRLRQAPLLSAYHLAEWAAWNWWRLRWEPRSNSKDWAFAHRLATIGSGYIWPNLTIFSDGERIALIARPTEERAQTPFRYITDRAVVIPASEFETELDLFLDQVVERLDWAKVADNNFKVIWAGVREERRTSALANARKLEALLGQDPNESDPKVVQQLLADAQYLGFSASEELAAEYGQSSKILSAGELREMAGRSGFDASPRSIVRLPANSKLPRRGQTPAWRIGAYAAHTLRKQEKLDGYPISDKKLADMAGVEPAALKEPSVQGISFALDENPIRSRIVLRSKWHEGRRLSSQDFWGIALRDQAEDNSFRRRALTPIGRKSSVPLQQRCLVRLKRSMRCSKGTILRSISRTLPSTSKCLRLLFALCSSITAG